LQKQYNIASGPAVFQNWHAFIKISSEAKVNVMETAKYITILKDKWNDLKKDDHLLLHLCILPLTGNDPLLFYFFLSGFTYLKEKATKVKRAYSYRLRLFMHHAN
jgi:hypothetical protein